MSNTVNIDSMIGKELAGRFQLIEKIGQGGMGAVFKAVHTQMGRPCAIKLLLPMTSDNDSALQRFKREAQMASRIDNPHAVTIYDFGEAENGMLYLAMEYIEGKQLGQLLTEERPLATERIVHIANQIAGALQAAHSLGIVHRDLKPDNIMITRKNEDADFVKVLDFGIAKPVDEDDRDNLTKTGFVLGTPIYMSPEQLSGEKLDARSDVYSLALIVYEMFSGRLPFEGDNSQAIMVKRLIAEPNPLRTFVPTMSGEVERAVMSALERNRDLRTNSVEVFAAQLKNALLATQSLSSRNTNLVSDEAQERVTNTIPENETNVQKSTDFIGSIKDSSMPLTENSAEGFAQTLGINQQFAAAEKSQELVTEQATNASSLSAVSPVLAPPHPSNQSAGQTPPSAFITKESKSIATPSANQSKSDDAQATLPLASEKAQQQFSAPANWQPSSQPQQPPTPFQQPAANYQTPQKTIAHQTPQQPVYQTPSPNQFQAQMPQQPYQTPVQQQSTGGNKTLLIGALGLILLLCLIGGSYFIYANYFNSPKPISTAPPTNPNAKELPTIPDKPVTKSNVEAATIHYESGKKHQEQAYSLLNSGAKAEALDENKKAIDEYKQAIALQAIYPQAHENLGVAYYSTGNLEASASEYKTAIEQYSQQQKQPTAQVLTNYGLALFDLKRYKDAADAFKRAYEIDASDSELLAHRGFALHNAGDIEGAKILYNQYLKAAPQGDYANGIKEILAGRAQPPATSGN